MKSFLLSFFLLIFIPPFLQAQNFIFDLTKSFHGQGDVIGSFLLATGIKNQFKSDEITIVLDERARDILLQSYNVASLELLADQLHITFVMDDQIGSIKGKSDFSFQPFFGGRAIPHFTDIAFNKNTTVTLLLDTMHGNRLNEIRDPAYSLYFKPPGIGASRAGILDDIHLRKFKKQPKEIRKKMVAGMLGNKKNNKLTCR